MAEDRITVLVHVLGDTGELDTAPSGYQPGALLTFGDDDGRDELGDPNRFLDEPVDDVDPELAPPDDEVHAFGEVELEDTSTRARWLQSALKALVDPTLVVDGLIGPRTRAAVKTFQRRNNLDADGIAGPKTIAALEAATRCTATHAGAYVPENLPEETEPSSTPPSPPPPDASALVVTERVVDGETEYVIRADGDEVSFRYWTPDWNDYKPFNVSRYKGAKRGILADAAILAGGYSRSELGILKANALKESAGAFGAINTWDDQIVSWGMAQFAGHAGSLAALLADLKEDGRTRASFEKWFSDNGIDVAYGEYPYKKETRTGWHVVVRSDKGDQKGDDGWRYIRTQPRLIGAFLLAGNDPAIQLGQVLYWRRSFLTRAIRKLIGKLAPNSDGAAVHRYLTAERSLAVIVRLHNWMPAYVVKWSNRFIAELVGEYPDVYSSASWNQAIETAFVDKVCAERKRVKTGSYDDYALNLSRTRGSFVGGR